MFFCQLRCLFFSLSELSLNSPAQFYFLQHRVSAHEKMKQEVSRFSSFFRAIKKNSRQLKLILKVQQKRMERTGSPCLALMWAFEKRVCGEQLRQDSEADGSRVVYDGNLQHLLIQSPSSCLMSHKSAQKSCFFVPGPEEEEEKKYKKWSPKLRELKKAFLSQLVLCLSHATVAFVYMSDVSKCAHIPHTHSWSTWYVKRSEHATRLFFSPDERVLSGSEDRRQGVVSKRLLLPWAARGRGSLSFRCRTFYPDSTRVCSDEPVRGSVSLTTSPLPPLPLHTNQVSLFLRVTKNIFRKTQASRICNRPLLTASIAIITLPALLTWPKQTVKQSCIPKRVLVVLMKYSTSE